jgi:hypothetical protein
LAASCGDTDRDYSKFCLQWDVILWTGVCGGMARLRALVWVMAGQQENY